LEKAKATLMDPTGVRLNSVWSREHVFALTTTIVLILVFVAAVTLSGGKTTTIAWFPLIVFLLLVVFSFELALVALVV
jgi:hypothetical protein